MTVDEQVKALRTTAPARGQAPSRALVVRSVLDSLAPVLALGFSLIVTFALYGPALQNAFLFDDALDLTRVEGRSYLSLLTSSEGYSYYRPLPFLIWKFTRDLLGYYDHTLLHALPILAHAVAGWLLFLLLRRQGIGYWAAVPALLFLTYPFSYQDVMITGVVFHPLVTMWMLAALNLYDLAMRAAGRTWLLLHLGAVLLAILALWTHESGVVILPLIAGLEAIHLLRRGERRPSLWVLAHGAATLAFVLAWFTVEKAPVADAATAGDLRPKGLFFLQGFTYPFSAQIRPLEDWLGVAPGLLEVGLLALLAAPTVVLVSAWLRGERRVRGLAVALVPIAAGLGIAVAAYAPVMVRLSWEYVIDAPRLLYLVGVGAAIFWGLLPALDFGRRSLTVVWRIISLGLLLAVVVQAWTFIERRHEMFAASTEAVLTLAESGERHNGGRLLVVNMPSWLALDEYEYPYGHLGAQAVPVYTGLERSIYVNSPMLPEVETASIEYFPAVHEGRYTFGPHGQPAEPHAVDELLRSGYTVVRIERDGDGFVAREGGRLVPGAADAQPSSVTVNGDDVTVSMVRGARIDGNVSVYVSWNVYETPEPDSRIVVQLRPLNGDEPVGYEGAALLGLSSPAQWQAGDRVDDVIWFHGLPSDNFEVWVGIATDPDASPEDLDLVPAGLVNLP